MVEYLRIQDIKGLRKCDLFNLGRVNVFSGKNNSGKSTILEGINNREKRSIGLRIDNTTTDAIFSSTANQLGFAAHDPNLEIYKNIVGNTLAEKDVWFLNEVDDFVVFVRDKFYDTLHLKRRGFPDDRLRNAFRDLFPSMPEAILLPPKRLLELSKEIRAEEAVYPQGAGILNYLFFAKNQEEGTFDSGIYTDIFDAFEIISSGYMFNVFLLKNNQVQLKFSYKGSKWIEALDWGLGLRDLLVILYFAIYPKYEIISIEEPENHLHPDMQRKLLHFLKSNTSKQFFLTTHSNIFLNNTLVDKIFFTYYDDSVKVDDATSRAAILNDIGYSVTDNLVSDLVILVEGPSDRPVLEEFLNKLGVLSKYDVKLWFLGGDIMDQLDLSVLAQKYNLIALIDNDPKSNRSRKRFIERCGEFNIPVFRLQRYSIENYFTVDALKAVFGKQILSSITQLHPEIKVEEQIGLDPKKSNRKIVREMSLDDIKDTDLLKFLLKVKTHCEQNSSS